MNSGSDHPSYPGCSASPADERGGGQCCFSQGCCLNGTAPHPHAQSVGHRKKTGAMLNRSRASLRVYLLNLFLVRPPQDGEEMPARGSDATRRPRVSQQTFFVTGLSYSHRFQAKLSCWPCLRQVRPPAYGTRATAGTTAIARVVVAGERW